VKANPRLEFRHSQDLVFYLQWKKINFAGAVEKEELANLIINHANTSHYYETGSTHSSSSTPNDFENYAQSFDQIKQTCQNLFTSISDKIASGESAVK
jgi:E3 ubiquitin-protein ligase RNF34